MSSSKKATTLVTVRGSITPSVYLARGKEKTVVLDEHWQRLITRGHVDLVESYDIPAEKPARRKSKPRTEPVDPPAEQPVDPPVDPVDPVDPDAGLTGVLTSDG